MFSLVESISRKHVWNGLIEVEIRVTVHLDSTSIAGIRDTIILEYNVQAYSEEEGANKVKSMVSKNCEIHHLTIIAEKV